MLKNIFIFYIFTTVQTWILHAMGACYHEWNNLGVRPILAEIRSRLDTNIIFTNIVVSMLTIKYWFLQLWFHHLMSANQDPLLTDTCRL